MSRHRFVTIHNDRQIEVCIGWDRPLRYFFCTVITTDEPRLANTEAHKDESEQDEEYGDEIIFSNLNLDHPFSMTLEDIEAKLSSLSITVPKQMIQETQADSVSGFFRETDFSADGSFVLIRS